MLFRSLRILEATEVGLRRKASEADLAAHEAVLALNQLIGRPMDSLPGEIVVAATLPAPPPLKVLLAAAQTNNFDLRIRASELEQQGFRVSLAHNERWPTLRVGPQFSEENAGSQDRIVGMSISLPLPLWRNNASNIEAARARHVQAETLLNTTRRDIERRVASASRACEVRIDEMSRWHPDSIRKFQEAAELAARH